MKQKSNPTTEHSTWMARVFSSKRLMAALSVVLAMCAWLAVIILVEPNKTDSISVRVDFTYNTAPYTSQGLDIVQKPTKDVDVQVSGDGVILGSLSAADFNVYPDYSNIKGPGEYQLRLKVEKRTNKSFDITNAFELPMVTVRLDKVVTQKFTVNVIASGIQPAKGYFLDQTISSPAEVTLTGPETDMSRVDKVVAKVDMNAERTESAIATSKLVYLDVEGKPITGTYITADVDQVEVTIPILKIKELPLVLQYSGVPVGYDPEQLNPRLSDRTILVAGTPAQVDALDKITAGYVDLTKFKLGEPVLCDVLMPAELRNVNNLLQITVMFDTVGYATKTVTVTNINAINKPAGTIITYPTDHINNVTLVGTQSELDALDAAGVVAQVDASATNLSVSNGQQNMTVKIIVPSTKTVFATGTYTVLCNIETQDGTQNTSTGSTVAK